MNSKKQFSIIELMTVILVILLLMSLLIPTFSKLKMNARNVLCKNQMRQLGILINSYASEHDGYLPDDLKSDIKPSAISNNELYLGWLGHLLPYVDAGLKSYNRTSALRKSGEVYTYDYVYGLNKGTTNPKNKLDGGWIVIHDAYHNGGFNELKIFICPEIHANTYDIGVSNDYNGLRVPRIDDLAKVFGANAWDYLGGGIPTTYLANDVFFGFDGPWMSTQKSLRMDQISSISKKGLLVEGGLADSFAHTNGEPSYVYYRPGRGDLSVNGIFKNNSCGDKFSYVHDTKDIFWVMNCQLYQYFPSYWMPWDAKREIATKFNNTFSGKASMVEGSYGYSIISYIDPAGKPFDKFFLANPPGVALLPFQLFDEPEFHYLTGDMNVLFGDGTVVTKDMTWLSMNRIMIGTLTKE